MRLKARLTAIVAAASSLASFATGAAASAAKAEYSKWMAASMMSRRQGIMTGEGGVSELLQAGFTQKAFLALVKQYPDAAATAGMWSYIEESAASVVPYVTNATRSAAVYPMDRLSNGMALLELSSPSSSSPSASAFGAAAAALRESIDLNRRNPAGGLWYFVYPQWSYLDGMYSLAPFYTLYARARTAPADDAAAADALADMYYQVDLLWRRTRHPAGTGLLVHGYDASGTAVWASPGTGASPHVWVRALGWYHMALVDTLELLSAASPSSAPSTAAAAAKYRALLLRKFKSLSEAVVGAADPATGAWWQVMDQPGREGNYVESSGSAMFAYALLKGARLGYLGCGAARRDAVRVAARAYDYLTGTFVVHEGAGDVVSYNGTVSVCSLNSTASYDYYVNQPIEYNSALGSNAYILASLEAERLR